MNHVVIPLDFVAGTHGHFLEYVLNRAFGFTREDFVPFNSLGSSHKRPDSYLKNRKIVCNHWFQRELDRLRQSPRVIRIVFDQDDLLLVTSLSLLRAGDRGIDNDLLHEETKQKLDNRFYVDTLESIYRGYGQDLRNQESIPRNVLREFFKFGFRDPDTNGFWIKLQELNRVDCKVTFNIPLKKVYDLDQLVHVLQDLARWLDTPLQSVEWLPDLHQQFLSRIPYLDHQSQCEAVIHDIVAEKDMPVPKLSMLQESYINARLENIFKKEMPFHPVNYFENTKDVLNYIKFQAPDL